MARVQKILKKMGVEKELTRRGAKAGDVVLLENIEFIYHPEN